MHYIKSEAKDNWNIVPNHVFGIQNALELPVPNARAYMALNLHNESRFCIVRMGHCIQQFLQFSFTIVKLTWTHHTNKACVSPFLNHSHTHRREGFVWSTEKQMTFIDSLFHNFYVPPVIFSMVLDEDGNKICVCVDRKQCLTSIVRFLNGLVCSQVLPL